jgi:cell division septal protein FtsQ
LKEQAPALFDKISDVRCDKELNQTLFLKGGVEIRFGHEDVRKRMPALETFLSKMGPAEDYEYIDLRFDKQVIASPKRAQNP